MPKVCSLRIVYEGSIYGFFLYLLYFWITCLAVWVWSIVENF